MTILQRQELVVVLLGVQLMEDAQERTILLIGDRRNKIQIGKVASRAAVRHLEQMGGKSQGFGVVFVVLIINHGTGGTKINTDLPFAQVVGFHHFRLL